MKHSPRLAEMLSTQLRLFADDFVKNRRKDILKYGGDKLLNSKSLYNSLDGKVTTSPDNGVFMMRIFFNTYGRYLDMTRRYDGHAGGGAMIKELEEWAKKEGLNKFRTGKYAEKYEGWTDQRILNEIAWGIVRKINRKEKTSATKWWNKGKTRDIENFYRLVLLRGVSEAIAADAKDAIQKKETQPKPL